MIILRIDNDGRLDQKKAIIIGHKVKDAGSFRICS
jgi:hypothetical protein